MPKLFTTIVSILTLTAQNVQSPITYLWNTGATTASITTQNAGIYGVTATGANGCPSLTVSKTISFNSLPVGDIIVLGNTTICNGDSVSMAVNTATANSVLWSNGATAKSIKVKTAGTYSAQLTSPQGCTNTTSNSVTVQVNQKPAVFITQNTNILTALPANASYQWFLNNNPISGATSQTLNITAGGNYSVVVTSSNGCSSTASIGAVLRVANPSLTYQVFPNPATDKIGISYTLTQGEKVSVRIKNQQGQNIITVIDNQQQTAGDYLFIVDAIGLQKGIVYVEFIIGNKIVSHKLVII